MARRDGRKREKQREERWEKIRGSQFNKWYKEVKGIGIPSYLKLFEEGMGGEQMEKNGEV